MLDKLIPFAFRILEVMFFTGATGCVLTILTAWVEMVADGFSDTFSDHCHCAKPQSRFQKFQGGLEDIALLLS